MVKLSRRTTDGFPEIMDTGFHGKFSTTEVTPPMSIQRLLNARRDRIFIISNNELYLCDIFDENDLTYHEACEQGQYGDEHARQFIYVGIRNVVKKDDVDRTVVFVKYDHKFIAPIVNVCTIESLNHERLLVLLGNNELWHCNAKIDNSTDIFNMILSEVKQLSILGYCLTNDGVVFQLIIYNSELQFVTTGLNNIKALPNHLPFDKRYLTTKVAIQ